MIACLPMYDHPELRDATDVFWSQTQKSLGRGPLDLSRGIDPWVAWSSPQLTLAQTCGLPYRARLYGQVQLAGTPDFGLPGCPPGYYNSVIVAHSSFKGHDLRDLAGKRFAYNEALSQSGWAAPIMHMRPMNMLPGSLIETGSHFASIKMVASGDADFAAIDAVAWDIFRQFDPISHELVEITRTEPTPAPPFITSRQEDAGQVFDALKTALELLSDAQRSTLRLNAIIALAPSDYLAVPTPPGPALLQDRLSA